MISRSIPTTSVVPPYKNTNPKSIDDWRTAVSTFCNGAQSVKVHETIASIRIGALIHIEGTITIDSSILKPIDTTVAPRFNVKSVAYDSVGVMYPISIDKGKKSIDVSELPEGEYYINIQYLAAVKSAKEL